jgi:CheY-like chemotaxis protein
MSCRVLVVDRDPKTRGAIGAMLERRGYQAILADGISAAAYTLSGDPPDLLITEIRLDGYNGLHLIATATAPVRAIVVTAYADAAIERDARRLGADYLIKPVDEEVLLAAVVRQLSRGRSEDLFSTSRQSQRARVPVRIMAELNGMPARVCDISDGGARLELQHPPAAVTPGPVPLRAGAFAGSAYVAWERKIDPGRWNCGIQVAREHADQWRTFVVTTLAALPDTDRA